MIHKIGLLPKDNHQQVPFAYKMYTKSDRVGWDQSNGFKRSFSVDVPIEFVGVWCVTTLALDQDMHLANIDQLGIPLIPLDSFPSVSLSPLRIPLSVPSGTPSPSTSDAPSSRQTYGTGQMIMSKSLGSTKRTNGSSVCKKRKSAGKRMRSIQGIIPAHYRRHRYLCSDPRRTVTVTILMAMALTVTKEATVENTVTTILVQPAAQRSGL